MKNLSSVSSHIGDIIAIPFFFSYRQFIGKKRVEYILLYTRYLFYLYFFEMSYL